MKKLRILLLPLFAVVFFGFITKDPFKKTENSVESKNSIDILYEIEVTYTTGTTDLEKAIVRENAGILWGQFYVSHCLDIEDDREYWKLISPIRTPDTTNPQQVIRPENDYTALLKSVTYLFNPVGCDIETNY